MISFLPLGGANEIGANSYYLNFNGNGILLDCGIHPKKTGSESLPQFNLLENKPLDHVIITHAHQDHIGSLPFLVKKFPFVKIYSTPQTRALAELVLHNSVRIMRMETTEENFEIFDHDEIDLLIKTINYFSYNNEFVLNAYHQTHSSSVKTVFYDAGHILGSSSVLLNNNGYKIFYTGDINLSSQTLLSGAEFPKEKINTLIIETTYGATDSLRVKSWHQEAEKFVAEINKVLNRGGSVLIPVFSLGKMQEMLSLLWEMMEKGKLTRTDIYTGGIGLRINHVYDYNRYVVPYNDSAFKLSDLEIKNYFEDNNSSLFFKSPSIVVASSGMMIEGTPSFNFAKKFLKQKNSAIFTVGYVDDETPGYKIVNASRGEEIKLTEFDKPVEVECEIKNFSFSAHSKREELLEIVEKLKPENVILVHGDEEAIDWMGSAVLKNFRDTKVYAAEPGKEIVLGK